VTVRLARNQQKAASGRLSVIPEGLARIGAADVSRRIGCDVRETKRPNEGCVHVAVDTIHQKRTASCALRNRS